ncbi:PspC domain-containing protein [Flavobacterium sp.]|uniref:PspC domain-containing protein n=1 Tax=Flavobacterium sp. TaxID=239 RepID=UPI00122A87C9|nr:PspC domain-containing protein [Flavobacterium sp.]RZJ69199.1 MAG: PspC domain-containing protein [Flavobacterium sp.]
MNKTVNINLGGSFFHIDEDAYQKLSRYFEAIKRSLNNSNGQDEIIKDIEMRIAEIISEKHNHSNQVINSREVDEVITIMGQPEDYRLEDDGEPAKASVAYDQMAPRRMKKLYRDTEKGMIGGVATGLGHYFGIDSVWIKILFLVFVFAGFGTGIIAYFVLWIVTPAAVTTAEKLEMRGEPVNISNIEKKVREEFDTVSEKIKNADYGQVKTGAEKFANSILEVLGKIFLAFAKVLGAIIVVFSAGMLILGVISLFTLGSSSLISLPWEKYAEAVNYTDVPIWAVGTLGFVVLGIPTFFLFILGLKLLVKDLKSIGNIAKYTLLALWLIAVGIAITLGVKQATEIGYDGKKVEKHEIMIAKGDTLYVKFRFNDYYAKDIDHRHNFVFVQDEKGRDVIYSNNVHIEVLKTDEVFPYVQIEKVAHGRSLSDARKQAEKIKYHFTVDGNRLTLDNYLLTELDDKFRDQEVKIYLYVPEGMYFKPDQSMQNFDWSDDNFFNLHWSGDYDYLVQKNKVICLNCPPEDMDVYDENGEPIDVDMDVDMDVDVDSDTIFNNENATILKADDKGVIIRATDKNTGKKTSLKMDENGVIIKSE